MPAKSAKTQRNMARAPGRGTDGTPATAADKRRRAAGTVGNPPTSRRWPILVAAASAGGLLAAAAMIALSLLSVASYANAPATGKSYGQQSDPRSKGSPNAPVVITEWFDFQCPACGRYALGMQPEIERLYVDTGKVRWVSRNYAFLGAESFLAAEAAQAAADQGRYWDYLELLFRRQRGENLGAFRPENLKRFAAELGLNQKVFNDALDQGIYRAAVRAEAKEAEALGVNATPTFFINGRKIEGVPTVQGMGKLIEEELARKR